MRRGIALALLALAGFTALFLGDRYYREQVRADNARALHQAAADTRDRLERGVDSHLTVVDGMRAFMLAPAALPDFDAFDRYAATVLADHAAIHGLAYVDPQRVIQHFYPLAGNEAAIGLDLTTRPAAPFVETAIAERRLTVGHPIVTVQGPLAIVARAPLFKGDALLGLVQGVVNVPAAVAEALDGMDEQFEVQLRDAAGNLFWGPDALTGMTQTATVLIGDNTWTLEIGWRAGPPPAEPFFVAVIWGLGGALLASLLFIVNWTWTRTAWLTRAVDEKTAALGRVNDELLAEIAERRRAVAALQQSEELYRTLFQNVPIGLGLADDDGNLIDFNQAILEPGGYTRADVEHLGNVTELYADLDERAGMRDRMAREGAVQRQRVRFKRKDGTAYDAQLSLVPSGVGDNSRWLAMVEDVTHRLAAEREIQRLADEFAVLYQTTRDLSAQHDLPRLLPTIVERAAALLAASGGALYLYDAGREVLYAALSTDDFIAIGAQMRLGEGIAGQVAETRQPQIVDDCRAWADASIRPAEGQTAAVVQVPMLYGGELVGVLVAQETGPAPRRFTERDARLLTLFASQAASAVANARLFEETHRRLAELEAVNKVSTALRTTRTLDELLSRLLDEMLEVLRTDAGVIWLYNAGVNQLYQAVAQGWFTLISEAPMRPGEGIVGQVFSSGEPHISAEFTTDPITRDTTRGQIPAGWGGASIPIRTQHETVGVLMAGVRRPRELTQDELQLLSTLAEIAGNAIHRSALYEQTELHLQRLTALHAVDMAINSSLDLRVTLNVLLDQVVTQLGVDAADVLLLNPRLQVFEFAAGRGFRTMSLEKLRLRLGEGIVGRAALERRQVHLSNLAAASDSPARAAALVNEHFVEQYVVPLVAKGQVVGVLELFHRRPLSTDADWARFLDTLAGQAAIAVDNARLFEELQRFNVELALAYDATIEGWATASEMREQEVEGHTQRVTNLAVRLARKLGVQESELIHIRRGALLHDVGNIGVPDSILLKPGPLKDEEQDIMRRHPVVAYEMLSRIVFLRAALDIPYRHHERWDGTGYPHGLAGERIPLAARIFAVADVWDALRSDRPYRQAWPEKEALDHVRSEAGRQFDPRIVDVFLGEINGHD